MLSNTLLQIEAIIQEKLNKETADEFLKFMKTYRKGMWIYPGVIKRKFSLSMSDVYNILTAMEKIGVLQSYYEMCCDKCQKSVGTVKLFNELPDSFCCEMCGNELSTLENTILIYKVVMDE